MYKFCKIHETTYNVKNGCPLWSNLDVEHKAKYDCYGPGIVIGSKVCLKHNPSLGTATVESFILDIKGAVVLDTYLDHFRCWNIDDLLIVKS